ncbi:hypothetical protein K469DRAFT_733817 [Zopfia rhizophila CBS 207.26]|uniref:Rhodopsin domain-containing protein n=1 Tax=Zopfia rhizophila CBS 207.26 TaxID=1314779 RepID=A0A6A6EU13_9PEZI|nr:hypothetical protein K469DRAFT_733817 [Zopfia rhizophila CBS 207.26]
MCGAPVRDITSATPIVIGFSSGAALFAVITRCISTGGVFSPDDIFAVASMVFALPMATLEFFVSADGFGKDIWTIPTDKIYEMVKFTWLTETSWDGEHKGKCINFHIFAWVHAGINIVLDAIIILGTIPELLKLSLSTKRKVYIVMMFSIGLFTTIVSVIRLKSLVPFSASTNPTYDNVPTAYWSVLEAFVGIFCVCMLALRRFLAAIFPRCFRSTQSNSKYNDYDNRPNKPSTGKRTGPKNSKASFGGSFGGHGEDDEVRPVELGWSGKGWVVGTRSQEGNERVGTEPGRSRGTFYKPWTQGVFTILILGVK